MKKILNVAVAAALCGAAVIVTSATADARWGYGGWGYHGGYHYGGWGYRGWGWGVRGGVAAAIIGAGLAAPYYYYPVPAYPSYYYYSYPLPAYYYYGVAPGCCY